MNVIAAEPVISIQDPEGEQVNAQTKAEIRARAMAKRLEDAGYTCKVKVEHSEPEYFESGGIMTPARVFVSVAADGPDRYSDDFGFSFVTWLSAPGHRTSTKFCGGHRYRLYAKPFAKRLSLRQLGYAIASELDTARYRKSQEA